MTTVDAEAAAPQRRPHPSPEERALAVKWYLEGDASTEIAERFGRSKAWVLNCVRAAGVNRPAEVAARPHKPTRASLVPELVRLLREGKSQRDASIALGFHVQHFIWQVRQGLISAPELLAVVGPARTCLRHRR